MGADICLAVFPHVHPCAHGHDGRMCHVRVRLWHRARSDGSLCFPIHLGVYPREIPRSCTHGTNNQQHVEGLPLSLHKSSMSASRPRCHGQHQYCMTCLFLAFVCCDGICPPAYQHDLTECVNAFCVAQQKPLHLEYTRWASTTQAKACTRLGNPCRATEDVNFFCQGSTPR